MTGSSSQPTGERSSPGESFGNIDSEQSPGRPQQSETASGTTGQSTPTPEPIDKVTALGHGVWLMSQVATHKHFFIGDIEWMLVPPVAMGQFRLWRNNGMPVGFAT